MAQSADHRQTVDGVRADGVGDLTNTGCVSANQVSVYRESGSGSTAAKIDRSKVQIE